MTSSANAPPKQTNRRLFRWLLATFVLAVMITVIAVALPIYQEHQAAQEWIKLGGSIMWSDADDGFTSAEESHQIELEAIFHHVELAMDPGQCETVELLRALRGFRNLDSLALANRSLTASDLIEIRLAQPDLPAICFQRCLIPDGSLQELGQFRQLKSLWLVDVEITDASLRHLQKMGNLKELLFSHSEITDDGLWHLRTLKSLRDLYVFDSRVTAEGVERLRAVLPDVEVRTTR